MGRRLGGRLGARLGAFLGCRRGLGGSWGVLGVSWGVLGRLGGVLEASWGVLGSSWGSSWDVIGRLGDVLGRLGAAWLHLGGVFGRLESVLGRLEAYNPHALESRLGSHNQPSTALNGTLRYASVMPIKDQLFGCFAGIILYFSIGSSLLYLEAAAAAADPLARLFVWWLMGVGQ